MESGNQFSNINWLNIVKLIYVEKTCKSVREFCLSTNLSVEIKLLSKFNSKIIRYWPYQRLNGASKWYIWKLSFIKQSIK